MKTRVAKFMKKGAVRIGWNCSAPNANMRFAPMLRGEAHSSSFVATKLHIDLLLRDGGKPFPALRVVDKGPTCEHDDGQIVVVRGGDFLEFPANEGRPPLSCSLVGAVKRVEG